VALLAAFWQYYEMVKGNGGPPYRYRLFTTIGDLRHYLSIFARNEDRQPAISSSPRKEIVVMSDPLIEDDGAHARDILAKLFPCRRADRRRKPATPDRPHDLSGGVAADRDLVPDGISLETRRAKNRRQIEAAAGQQNLNPTGRDKLGVRADSSLADLKLFGSDRTVIDEYLERTHVFGARLSDQVNR
jgi:hypothetical protein